MEYYAHPNELLIDHLQLTSRLAEVYGNVFHSGVVAKQLGLLHDVGKRTMNFQAVLNHTLYHQDHAAVAAVLYNEQKYVSQSWLRQQMSLMMAAHHSRLYSNSRKFAKEEFHMDRFDSEFARTKDRNKQFASTRQEYEDIKQYAVDNNLILNITENDVFDTKNMSENERMLYVRMLFSCLVDADYSATSVFINDFSVEDFIDKPIPAKAYFEKLSDYRNAIRSNSKSDSRINVLRDKIYDQCCEKGSIYNKFATLTAPTGCGKTLALMAFALKNAEVFKRDRIIIILPYLSIINQNANEYKKIFGDENVLIDDSQTEFTDKTRLESDRWSAFITVTTSVKFFETLFSDKAADLRRLHNVANSVIVFDECQTLPSNILNVTIEALQSLTKHYNSTVLFSTATKPSYQYRDSDVSKFGRIISHMEWHADEIIDDVQSVFDDYGAVKKLSVERAEPGRDFFCTDLLDYYRDENQVMYVFNTVRHACDMYDALLSEYDKESCFLITGRFCALDKSYLIKTINDRLKSGETTYLAATQCIEAGVDFDFQAGAREYAPFDSIVQTAGRINRNGKYDGKLLIFRYKDHGRYDYPSVSYMNTSNCTASFISGYDDFDLYDLDIMDAYYKRLYNIDSCKCDNEDLCQAIYDNNYTKVIRNYRMIDDGGQITMIVRPLYASEEEMQCFDEIVQSIRFDDYVINKALMKKLAPYTVSVYVSKQFDPEYDAVKLSFRKHGEKAETNWYLLNDNSELYSERGFVSANSDSAEMI